MILKKFRNKFLLIKKFHNSGSSLKFVEINRIKKFPRSNNFHDLHGFKRNSYKV
jgi:hypothetical protein